MLKEFTLVFEQIVISGAGVVAQWYTTRLAPVKH